MNDKKLTWMATIANRFLEAGNVRSYRYMKAKIFGEIHRQQVKGGCNG